jgi:hypothetical protein
LDFLLLVILIVFGAATVLFLENFGKVAPACQSYGIDHLGDI